MLCVETGFEPYRQSFGRLVVNSPILLVKTFNYGDDSMKIAASFSMGRLAPKHNLNIDGIRGLSPNVTAQLIKDDIVIIDNLRTGSGTYHHNKQQPENFL